jgi:putative Mn2+ efflux pump MntP
MSAPIVKILQGDFMALNEYEQKIWDEMSAGLEDSTLLEKVEKEEVTAPYSRRLIAGVVITLLGFIGMIVSVAYTNTITGAVAFILAFIGAMLIVESLRFKPRKFSAPRNNKYFDNIWNRLNGS